MLRLTCPNCGPRNVSEFRYGGETNARPKDPAALSDAEWASYLYLRANVSDVQTEWWFHRYGCGLWFLAERHTYTNDVLQTFLWAPAQPATPAPPGMPGDTLSAQSDLAQAQGTDPAAEG